MKSIFIVSSAILTLSLTACTHTDTQKSHTEKPHTGAEHEHPEFMASVKSYHDVMSKDWHAQPGADRTASTCGNIKEYAIRARAITATAAPESTTQTAWDDASEALLGATMGLCATCNQDSKDSFDDDFTTLHDKFHSLIKLLPKKSDK